MWKELILLSVIAVTLTSSLKVQCKHDSECGTDECCFYHEGPMIMSKRQTLVKVQCKHDSECGTDECCYYHEGPMVMSNKTDFFPVPGMVQGGWCEKYQPQGEYRSSIAKTNGHCGCAPGLKCK